MYNYKRNYQIRLLNDEIFLAFHICAGEEELQIFSFLCPNGTLFNQQYFVCDWWFNVDCDNTQQFYSLNDELDVARQEADQSNYGSEILKVNSSEIGI